MPVKPLVVVPDSRLFLCSEEVREEDFPSIDLLISDMFETMYAEGGLGIAAVQIGVHKRIFLMDLETNNSKLISTSTRAGDTDSYLSSCGPTVIINPEVLETSRNCITVDEGCLSVPDQREAVSRPERIVIRYLDQNAKPHVMKACGLLARCIQHEMDHLNGVVFLKHISKFKRDLIMAKMRKAATHT